MNKVKIGKFIAGDTFTISQAYDETWNLQLQLISETQQVTIPGVYEDGQFKFVFSSALSATLSGVYSFRIGADKSGVVRTVKLGEFFVAPSFEAAIDLRTYAKKTLDAITDTLLERATDDQRMITIAGEQIIYYSFDQLQRLKEKYERIVRNEERAEFGKRDPRIVTRFTRGRG